MNDLDIYCLKQKECIEYIAKYCNVGMYAMHPLSALVHYVGLLWFYSELLQARRILEIGIGPNQVSGMTFIYSMSKRPGSKLISIDAKRTHPLTPGYDCPIPSVDNLRMAADLGVEWERRYGDSISEAILVPEEPMDMVYIDGDHTVVNAYGDFKKFYPCVRPGGYLIFDDIGAYPGPTNAVRMLVSEGYHFLWHKHDATNGHAVIRKPNTDEPWEGR